MRYFLIICLAFIFSNSYAQKQRLTITGYSPGLYLEYPVNANETFASIASIYNLTPDSLAEFNDMDYYEGTLRAKILRIPLSKENFDQQGNAGADEALVPVYFMATYNQSLQQITTKVKRVPIASLKKWNESIPDLVPKGTDLIVGFIKAKTDKLAYFENPVSASFVKVETNSKRDVVKKVTAKAAGDKSTSTTVKTPEVRSDIVSINEGGSSNIPKTTANVKVDSSKIVAKNTKTIDLKKNNSSSTIRDSLLTTRTSNTSPTKNSNRTKVDTTTELAINNIKKAENRPPSNNNKVDSSATAKSSTSTRPNSAQSLNTKASDTSTITAKNTRPSNSSSIPNRVNSIKIDTATEVSKKITDRNQSIDKAIPKPIESSTLIANTTGETKETKKVDTATSTSTASKIPFANAITETKTNNKSSTVTSPSNNNINAAATVKQPDVRKTEVAKTTNGTNTSTNINLNTVPAAEKSTTNSYLSLLNNQAFEGVYNSDGADKVSKQLAGDASFFESRSGWNDKKFYVLMPEVPAGTIVKITSNDNRSVYAKVLGAMPEMKENDGILLRLSNSAVAALGISNQRFPVVVTYY